MRILFLTDGLTPFVTGGMQRHSENLIKTIFSKVDKLDVAHCTYNDNIVPSDETIKETWGIQSDKVVFYGFKFPRKGKLPGHYIRNSKVYSQLLFSHFKTNLVDYDFIYSKGFTGIAFLKNDFNIPVGVMLHGLEMFQKSYGVSPKLKSILLRPIAKFCLDNADYIFSYGGKISDLILSLGIPESKLIESSGGISEDWIRKSKEKNKSFLPRKLLFIGRNERRKGLSEFYSIITELDLGIEVHFIGPLQQKEDPRFFYHGLITETTKVKQIMDNMDVLICPSHSEGMPNVIMESMARGLAIIATNVGATRLLVDESNGWIIEPQIKHQLRSAIIACAMEDLEDRKRNSISRIENFTFERIGNLFIESLKSKIYK